MYRIEGDGSWQNTKIWRDGELIDWSRCVLRINNGIDSGISIAEVDDDIAPLSRVMLLGVYKLIGDGKFQNTKLFINDELLRGIQSVVLRIEENKDPMLGIKTVFLPNLVEFEEKDNV